MKGVKILNDMYKMIFKRKSFHQFPQTEENITEKELAKINEKIAQLTPLVKDTKNDVVLCVPYIDLFYSLLHVQGTNIKMRKDYILPHKYHYTNLQ